MTAIYPDILDPKRKKIFSGLKSLKALGGTLAGGTALALQIKHRYSLDFDVFFNRAIIEKSFSLIKKTIGFKEEIFHNENNITFLTPEEIRITLFHYEFLPLYSKVKTASIDLFNLKDIAADKAYTLGRRPIWRDYVDLFFLLKDKHLTLNKIVKDATRKFKNNFAIKLFLEQLTYYKDIKNFNTEFISKKYRFTEIQDFLKKEVLQNLKQEL